MSVVIGGGDEGALAGQGGDDAAGVQRLFLKGRYRQAGLKPGPSVRWRRATTQRQAGRQAVEHCPYPEVARNLLLHVTIELLIRPSALARQRREKPHTQRWVGGLAAPAGRAAVLSERRIVWPTQEATRAVWWHTNNKTSGTHKRRDPLGSTAALARTHSRAPTARTHTNEPRILTPRRSEYSHAAAPRRLLAAGAARGRGVRDHVVRARETCGLLAHPHCPLLHRHRRRRVGGPVDPPAHGTAASAACPITGSLAQWRRT